MIFGKISGLEKLNEKLKSFEVDMKDTQIRAVRTTTLMLHKAAVGLIQDNGDGSPQIRYSPKRVVNVSRPGEAPNTDTGRLAQSIQFDFQDEGLTGRVGTNLKYGKMLEFGTSKMQARPWLSTAVLLVSKEAREIFQKAFRKAMKSAAKGVGIG